MDNPKTLNPLDKISENMSEAYFLAIIFAVYKPLCPKGQGPRRHI